jgi:hypothetical protein
MDRPAADRPGPDRPAAEPSAEPSDQESKPRRSRFGRLLRGNRTGPQPEAEPKIAPRDEEYVDWVSGLGGDRKPGDREPDGS